MALPVVTNKTPRNRAGNEGDDTLGSGFPKAQTFRGQGNEENAYQVGPTNRMAVFVGEYDFSKDGAIAAAGTFGTGVRVPANNVVVHVIVRIATALGGNTNMSFGLLNDADLLAAIANPVAGTYTGDISLAVGGVHTVITGAVLTGTTPKEITLQTSGAATSAGKVTVYVFTLPVVG